VSNGASNATCGTGGNVCTSCTDLGGVCASGTRSCVFAPDAGCSGCFDGFGSCVPASQSASSVLSCGLGGNSCLTCSAGQACQFGLCVTGDAGSSVTVGNSRVRLVEGNGVNSGRLEAFIGGVWGQVCDDVFYADNNGPNVVCRDLGFTGGTQSDSVGPNDVFVMDDVTCTGTEATLQQCSYVGQASEDCSSSEAVFITCF
jgi:hypothetical protein